MKVVNLFGAPCSGKSTNAFGIAYEMKKRYHKAELVTEFAKELVWSGSEHILAQQNLVLAEQTWRQERLKIQGREWVVTDCPLLLSSFYGRKYRPDLPQCFHDWCRFCFDAYENENFFLVRNHPYEKEGRLQNEEESDRIAIEMKKFLDENGISYRTMTSGDDVPMTIIRELQLDWFDTPDK